MRLLAVLLTFNLFTSGVLAVVDVDLTELQSSISIIFPDKNTIPQPKGYEKFDLQSKASMEGGVYAIYEAKFLGNPAITDELPRMKLSAFLYADQSTAGSAFASIANYGAFYSGRKNIISQDDRTIFYASVPGSGVDIFGGIVTEDNSLHMLHLNGNLLFHASLYRNSGEYYRPNIEAFTALVNDSNQVKEIFIQSINFMKLSLGVLYQPSKAAYSAISEKSSLNLSDLYSIPKHGSIGFDIYINDPVSAVGTILDSSGIDTAEAGDLYLYVNDKGALVAGIYAPDFDSSCSNSAGWYKIETSTPLNPYEWNEVSLRYGVRGFGISINNVSAASCDVSQPRSNRNVYFGDYPDDTIYESMSGYINKVKMNFDATESGALWDDVLSNQLFLDLSNNDPDVDVFQYLQEKGIMLGSEGNLRPEENLNRAEMVKLLLKAYNHSPEDGAIPFWDVDKDAWYAKYLATAYKIGMIEGHADGRFLPGHEINRAEFFTILFRVSGQKKVSYDNQYTDVSSNDWYLTAAAFAAARALLTDSAFDASKSVSRREAARAIYALIK